MSPWTVEQMQAMAHYRDRAIEHRLAGGVHYHHQGCIHNLPPEEQVAMRGWTVEKWLAIIGTLPEQITPAEWESQPYTLSTHLTLRSKMTWEWEPMSGLD